MVAIFIRDFLDQVMGAQHAEMTADPGRAPTLLFQRGGGWVEQPSLQIPVAESLHAPFPPTDDLEQGAFLQIAEKPLALSAAAAPSQGQLVESKVSG